MGTELVVLPWASWSMALVACAGVAACSGVSTHRSGSASGGTGGTAIGTGGGGGIASGGGGSGGVAMGGACDKEPLPSAGTPPGEVGCYTAEDGGTWVRVPCNCELLLENSEREDAEATISLRLSDPSLLVGSTVAELDVPDPEYEFFDIWTRQVGSATTFFVSWADGVTTVRLGVPSVTLDAVPLRACESRPGVMRFDGPVMTALELEAVLVGPEPAVRFQGECRTLAHPTPSPG